MGLWNNNLYLLAKKERKLISANLGNLSEQIKFSCCSAFKDLQIKKIAFGLSHMLILTEDGVVFGIGNNDFGQIGIVDTDYINTAMPIKYFIENNIRISDIICGDDHSLFIRKPDQENPNSQIFGCGKSINGELGFINELPVCLPLLLQTNNLLNNGIFMDQIHQVVCGSTFTILFSGNQFHVIIYQQLEERSLFQDRQTNLDMNNLQRLLVQTLKYRKFFLLIAFFLLLTVNLSSNVLVHGQLYQFIDVEQSFKSIKWLQTLNIKKIYFQNYFIFYAKDKKNDIYLVNLQASQFSKINEKISHFIANSKYLSYCFANHPQINQSVKRTIKTPMIQSRIKNSSVLLKSSKKASKTRNSYQPTSSMISTDKPQLLQNSIKLFNSLKINLSIEELEQKLELLQQENMKLKSELQQKNNHQENDQKLIKMLCENLDSYQQVLPCNQCKLYEIEIQDLKKTVQISHERIEELENELARLQKLEKHNEMHKIRSPTTLTVDPSVFSEITSKYHNNIDQVSNRLMAFQSAKYSPSNITFKEEYSKNYRSIQQTEEIDFKRTSVVNKIFTESVRSETFDDFLNKSAQKLKSIIRDSSATQKTSQRKNNPKKTDTKENVYDISPQTLESKFQTSKINMSYENSTEKPVLVNFREKLVQLQESKKRLQERLGKFEDRLRNSAIL